MTTPPKNDLILVAQVSAAIGLQGEFRLLSFMDDPSSVLKYSPLLNDKGEPALKLTKARGHKDALVVRAEGVTDRTAADRIKGLKLYIDRVNLPEPDTDEYYITDLIGLTVFDTAGVEIGKVMAVDNFGAGDLLDIKPLDGVNYYVLFTQDNVPEVKLHTRQIIVNFNNL
jgi:16S rRNA processing protein RimM